MSQAPAPRRRTAANALAASFAFALAFALAPAIQARGDGQPPDPDKANAAIDALVAELGAPTYAARERATARLRELGVAALPRLRELADTAGRPSSLLDDPEIAARLDSLVLAVERDLAVAPTLVALDYRDVPLDEVVESLRRRSALEIELNPGAPRDRPVTLVAPDPVPFWDAIERLCRAADLGPPGGAVLYERPLRRMVLRIEAEAPDPRPATAVVGPVRLRVLVPSAARAPLLAERPPRGLVRPGLPFPNIPAHADPSLLILEAQIEPGRALRLREPPRVTEIIDDRGRELATLPGNVAPFMDPFADPGAADSARVRVQIPLSDLEPGQTALRSLKGVLPLDVLAPRVLERPIPEILGQPLDLDGLRVVLERVAPRPDGAWDVALSASFQTDDVDNAQAIILMGPNLGPAWNALRAAIPEFLDREGRSLPVDFSEMRARGGRAGFNPLPVGPAGEIRWNLRVGNPRPQTRPQPGPAGDDGAPPPNQESEPDERAPARVRLHLTRAFPFDVPFEFARVPLRSQSPDPHGN